MEYASKALQMITSFQVFLPDEGDLKDAKVVYLLHGLTDNCTGWTRYSSCERYARERGVALVIPEVQRSFYIDGVYGLNYFTFVSQELPAACHRMFGLSMEKEKSYVMGLSMGGYGALKCALIFPDRYAGCGSFSGVTDLKAFMHRQAVPMQPREFTALLGGDHKVAPENDIPLLAKNAVSPPPIYLSCGEQDPHYPMNCAFAEILENSGHTYRFDHREGSHSWDFWDQSIQDCFGYFFG
ncbi:MAG: alpha/beta hydrolase family protein [Desulfovibrionaceae bacterium]|nr:alpha/beta hydrolase family protein [Desulfovibrionaceae bacterium]